MDVADAAFAVIEAARRRIGGFELVVDDLAAGADRDTNGRIDLDRFLRGNEPLELAEFRAGDVGLGDPALGVVAVAGDIDGCLPHCHAIEIPFRLQAIFIRQRAELGLGIHGEPGADLIDFKGAKAVAEILCDRLFKQVGKASGYALLLNNLGSTTLLEMGVLAKEFLSHASGKKNKTDDRPRLAGYFARHARVSCFIAPSEPQLRHSTRSTGCARCLARSPGPPENA
ncbi:MAG: dihydroxyacetone kinase subunit DhaK, partial [Rhizobiales bacterium]|nr:dihydroxyacetone kinase subunit DhaK [Hyphomicrobiales bacterium]